MFWNWPTVPYENFQNQKIFEKKKKTQKSENFCALRSHNFRKLAYIQFMRTLINNVYIKNKIEPKSANEVIEEEEEGSENNKRPFGYVDS